MENETKAATTCESVLGGWQTKWEGHFVGPIMNKTTDLWNWQREYFTPDVVATLAHLRDHGFQYIDVSIKGTVTGGKTFSTPINARSVAAKASWENEATRAARASRHWVEANGVMYTSMDKAFKALRLPEGDAHGFRRRLVDSVTQQASFAGIEFKLVKPSNPSNVG